MAAARVRRGPRLGNEAVPDGLPKGMRIDTRPSVQRMAEFDALAPSVRAKIAASPFDISPAGLNHLPPEVACRAIDAAIVEIRARRAREQG